MLTQPQTQGSWEDAKPTALLVLADGTVLEGVGFGATGQAVGEDEKRRRLRLLPH